MYSGFMFKIGDFVFPMKYILVGSIKTVKKDLDLDSYRDANGLLHRESLLHWVANASFDVVPCLSEIELSTLMKNIRDNYTVPKERRACVTIYIPEISEYVPQDMYIPDIEIGVLDDDDTDVLYDSFKMEFIGY